MAADLRDRFSVIDPELLFLDPPETFDSCVIGLVEQAGGTLVVCYDRALVVEALVGQGMDADEAEEFFAFNTAGAYVGPKSPMFLNREVMR